MATGVSHYYGFQCFFCLSLWISAPFAFVMATAWPERAMTWLALSTGAILIELQTLKAS